MMVVYQTAEDSSRRSSSASSSARALPSVRLPTRAAKFARRKRIIISPKGGASWARGKRSEGGRGEEGLAGVNEERGGGEDKEERGSKMKRGWMEK